MFISIQNTVIKGVEWADRRNRNRRWVVKEPVDGGGECLGRWIGPSRRDLRRRARRPLSEKLNRSAMVKTNHGRTHHQGFTNGKARLFMKRGVQQDAGMGDPFKQLLARQLSLEGDAPLYPPSTCRLRST